MISPLKQSLLSVTKKFTRIVLSLLSLSIIFSTRAEAVTRFYLPSTGTPAISPAADSSWEKTSDLIRLSLTTSKIASTQLIQSGSSTATTGTFDVLLAQYISEPLSAQTITGTVKGVTKARETNSLADLRTQVLIKVVSGDGTVERGTLLAHDAGTLTSEWSTSSTLSSRYVPVALRSNTLSPVVAQAGDRVVVEIGYRRHTTTDATSYTGRLYFQDDVGSDLPESDSDATVGDPWIEFSQTLFSTPTHTVEQGNWQWFSDNTPDTSMTQLAAENTAPTLTGAQMQNANIRLRAQITETGAAAGSGTITVQYGGDGTNWNTLTGPSGGTGNQPNYWFRFIDGAATDGGTISSQLLTGTNESGTYHEDTGDSESVGASKVHEIDLALMVRWPPPDETVRFRILYNGMPLTLGSGKTEIQLTTSPAADRPHTITRLDPDAGQLDGRELRFSFWNRFYFDGTRWWFFTVQYNTPLVLRSYSWEGPGNPWVERTSFTFDTNGQQGRNSLTFKTIGGVPTVFVNWGASTTSRRLAKGTISGTTITWTNLNLSQTTLGQTHHVAVDDGNFIWIGGMRATDTIYARRSTNSNDISTWQSEKTLSDTGLSSPDEFVIIGLSSDKAIAVWHNGTDGALKWALVTDSGGFGTVNTLAAIANPQDWGWTRSGGYIYLVHTDATGDGGNWKLKVFNETSSTWQDGTDPGVSGQNSTHDGIAVTKNGNDIYALSTFEGSYSSDRVIKYIKYSGPGPSSTWGSLTSLSPTNRGNGDRVTTAPESDGSRILYGFEFSDDDLLGNAHTAEYHYLGVTLPSPTPTPTTSTTQSTTSTSQTSASSSCTSTPPSSIPNLFQINAYETSATLYFAPSGDPVNSYVVAYGPPDDPERYGVIIDQGQSTGVIEYTINYLPLNSTYTFKIKGANNCAYTNWSQSLQATTSTQPTSYYPNFLSRIIQMINNFISNIGQTIFPTSEVQTYEPGETTQPGPSISPYVTPSPTPISVVETEKTPWYISIWNWIKWVFGYLLSLLSSLCNWFKWLFGYLLNFLATLCNWFKWLLNSLISFLSSLFTA